MKSPSARLIFFLIFPIVLTFHNVEANDNQPKAKKGKIKLSLEQINNADIPLNGEWEIYWNQLLSPENFNEGTNNAHGYVDLPALWNEAKVGYLKLTNEGYATYRLLVDIPRTDELLGLELPAQYNSYKIWVNGKLLASNGEVGTSVENSKAQWLPLTKPFALDRGYIEIVFQVANFQHNKGGVYLSPRLGLYETLANRREFAVAVNMTIFGCLLLIGLFFLGLFLFWRNDKSLLYFSLFCVVISYRFIGSELYILVGIFPDIPWELVTKLEYISLYLGVALMYLFILKLFPKAVYKPIIQAFQYFTIALIVLTICTPVRVFSYMISPYQIVLLLYIIYGVFVCVKAYQLKYDGAIFANISLLILLGATTINSLGFLGVLPHYEFVFQFGFLAFVFTQTFILAFRFSRAFHQVETLKEQTLLQKQDIEGQNNELVQQKEEIFQQQEEILAINETLHIKNQHIMDSIRYAQTIQSAFLPQPEGINKLFAEHFVIYRPKDVVSGDFYWVKPVGNKIFFSVGDCTGHGVPGAFMSIVGISLLKEITELKGVSDPTQILEDLHEGIIDSLRQNNTSNADGMDIAICAIELHKNGKYQVDFAGAKSHLFYTEKGEFKMIKGTRRGIGGTRPQKNERLFEKHSLLLDKGESIYLASDGLIDQNDANKKRFSSTRFYHELQQVIGFPLNKQGLELETLLDKHQGNELQRDDITVMGVKL